MRVIYGLDQLDPPLPHSVLTVGNYDGVHVGHQEILRQACSFAAITNGPVVVLTFDPHPLAFVAPAKAPLRLSSLPDRIHRLAEAGADVIVVAKSERRLLTMEAEQFIKEIMFARFHPTHIVEGASFGFGKGRKGTPQTLQAMAKQFAWHVEMVPPVSIPDERGDSITVSSSLIRKLLMDGEVAGAARCLGRPYAIESTVIRAAGRGRTIGFPTANIAMPEGQVEPAEGVYAGRTWVGENAFGSAISIGRSETFGKNKRQIETHLLEFQGDLYGSLIRVEFLERIRAQQKFPSVHALTGQIQLDIDAVRTVLSRSI